MRTRTHEEFIQKLNEKHPDRDWKVLGEYEHNQKPILLEDKYGKCLITPNALLSRSKPSVKTAIDKTAYTINKFKELWGEDMFDYSEFEYKGTKTKSTIICKAKGHKFLSHTNNHLCKRGCPKCAEEGIAERASSNTEEFVEKAEEIHGDFYDYSKVDYKGAKTPVTITCGIHGDFKQKPNGHLSGNGCPKCATERSLTEKFYKSAKGKECSFYLIECWNKTERFVKIGVTGSSVSTRFSKPSAMPYSYKILRCLKSYDYAAVRCFEWECLNVTDISWYNPSKKFNGYTECRNLKVKQLLLDYIDNAGDIDKRKSFTLMLMGKDEEFNKRYKDLTGISHSRGMANLNENLAKLFKP